MFETHVLLNNLIVLELSGLELLLEFIIGTFGFDSFGTFWNFCFGTFGGKRDQPPG